MRTARTLCSRSCGGTTTHPALLAAALLLALGGPASAAARGAKGARAAKPEARQAQPPPAEARPANAPPPAPGPAPDADDEEADAADDAASAARAGDYFEERFRLLSDELREHIASPRAAAALYRLHSLQDRLPSLAPLARVLARTAANTKATGDVRALATWLHARVELARGRTARAAELFARVSLASEGWLIGGFDNEGGSGHNTAFPPEAGPVDLRASHPGKEREISWQRFATTFPDGRVPVGDLLRPRKNATFYFLASLEAPAAARAQLHVGASGAMKLWVNGQLALDDAGDHPARFDQRAVAVTLAKGANLVLLKVSVLDETPAFFVRAAAPGGLPLAGARFAAPAPAAPVAPAAPLVADREVQPPPPAPADDAATLVARLVEASPQDGRLREDLATLLDERRPHDTKLQSARRQQERAAALLPDDARAQVRLASYIDDDHNVRRRALEDALRADPKFAVARTMLGQYWLDRGLHRRALQELERALADRPDYWPAALARLEAWRGLGLEARSRAEALRLASEFKTIPAVVKEAARAERALGRPKEAAARLRVVLSQRYEDTGARTELAALLTDLGDVDGAAAELNKVLELAPTTVPTGLRLASLLAANGRVTDAISLCDKLAALAPDDESVPDARGRHRLLAGDADAAVRDFHRALELKPQNPALRELLRSVRPGENFAAPWLRDAAALAAAARRDEPQPAAGDDAVVLSELTVVRVYPNGLSSRTRQHVVRVLTDRGVENERVQSVRYSPGDQEVRVLQARLVKPDGSIVESRSETDRQISEPVNGMYFDYRQKFVVFQNLAPGDVLEFTWRIDDSGRENMFADYFGDIEFLQGTDRRLDTEYVLVAPEARRFHHNTPALPGLEHAVESPGEGRRVWRWRARNVPKIQPEPRMPGWIENAAYLHVSTFKEWNEVARFWWGLVREQLHPTPEVRAAAEEAVRGVAAGDVAGRVRAVYGYVVRKTRYVGLEFGIHGFKPYKVDRVLARRFGDCKDKASLMHAMLKTLGIESRLVLIRMHHLGLLAPEPASLAAFNHAILYVPSLDLYLDGTAEHSGSRELPASDEGARALIVEEDPNTPSRWVTTPFSAAADNTIASDYDLVLAADGSARLAGRNVVRGHAAAGYRRSFQSESGRREKVEQAYAQTWPGSRAADVTVSDPAELEKPLEMGFTLEIPALARAEGGGLALSVFGEPYRYAETLAPLSKRTYPVDLGSPWRNEFRYAVRLPPGMAPAETPAALERAGAFGSWRIEYALADGVLVARGHLSIGGGRVTPEDYPQFRAFLAELDKAFSRKLRLVAAPSAAGASAAAPTPEAGR